MSAPIRSDAAATAHHTAARIAAALHHPPPQDPAEPWRAHSLAEGHAGGALLHIERARTGDGGWETAHAWITAATSGEISAADNTGLFLGAPALAAALAATGPSPRYARACRHLDQAVAALAHRRVNAAMGRIDRGGTCGFADYDVFYGLTGIGAQLLHRDPGNSALGRILDYLVRLTRPLRVDGTEVPGWWVHHDPHRSYSPFFAHGHANHGAAHGIAGPLLLLSQALRRGHSVEGHREAVETICHHLDTWQRDHPAGAWWPEQLSLAELRSGRCQQTAPARPSWCYGTPGIARAQQVAAIATGDYARQRMAETALVGCLTDSAQTTRLIDAGLCHGWGGAYQTAWRAARDASDPRLCALLPTMVHQLTSRADRATPASGFLEGRAGTALALMTAATDTAPTTGWDSCLLID
ncbi:lanthionine synthetase C family protein [Streptomonospora sediminis]